MDYLDGASLTQDNTIQDESSGANADPDVTRDVTSKQNREQESGKDIAKFTLRQTVIGSLGSDMRTRISQISKMEPEDRALVLEQSYRLVF